MKLIALVENSSISEDLKSEHGLSLYIEACGKKLLFDMGQGTLFLENAEKINVRIEDAEIAVISHGHYDHGGGLRPFLDKNKKAPVYIQKTAFEKHYATREDGSLEDVGIDEELRDNKRIVFTGDYTKLFEGLELFADVTGGELPSSCNNVLFEEKQSKLERDSFSHEQNLIIEENGRTVLISGCSHNGIVNIVNKVIILKGKKPDYIVGGFHLYDSGSGRSEDSGLVSKVGEFLAGTGAQCYTCHCTGFKSYDVLKEVVGERLNYLATGDILEII